MGSTALGLPLQAEQCCAQIEAHLLRDLLQFGPPQVTGESVHVGAEFAHLVRRVRDEQRVRPVWCVQLCSLQKLACLLLTLPLDSDSRQYLVTAPLGQRLNGTTWPAIPPTVSRAPAALHRDLDTLGPEKLNKLIDCATAEAERVGQSGADTYQLRAV